MIMITARFEGSFSRKMELYRYGRSILSNGSEQDALDAPTISVCTTSQSYAHSELKEIALWLVSTRYLPLIIAVLKCIVLQSWLIDMTSNTSSVRKLHYCIVSHYAQGHFSLVVCVFLCEQLLYISLPI